MKKSRRDFLKTAGLTGFGLTVSQNLKSHIFEYKSKRSINKVVVDNALATLEDGSILSIPFWRIESSNDGPSLLLIAAQHGNEVQGAEVARRFKEVCTRKLVSGSIWLLPMANILAVRSRKHSFDLGPEENNRLNPEKLHNMQRYWPGDPQGNDTARLTYSLDQAVVRHCSHGVDIHCWQHFVAAETLSVDNHDSSRLIGEVTTTRFLRLSSTRPPEGETMSFSQLIRKRGGGAIVIELSGQFQMQERQVEIGLSSMINIAKQLGMIDGEPELITGPRAVYRPENNHMIYAPCNGIFMPALRKDKSVELSPEDFVDKGQILGHIINENNLSTVPITAPVSGYIWQFGMCHWSLCDASLPAQHPYAEEGDRIALIVTV